MSQPDLRKENSWEEYLWAFHNSIDALGNERFTRRLNYLTPDKLRSLVIFHKEKANEAFFMVGAGTVALLFPMLGSHTDPGLLSAELLVGATGAGLICFGFYERSQARLGARMANQRLVSLESNHQTRP